MLDLFLKGGIMMYFLLLTSVVAVAVIIERAIVLRRKKVLIPEVVTMLEQIKSPGDLQLAESVCRKFDAPFTRIILTSLKNQDLPPEELRRLVEDQGRQEVRSLQRGLTTLETAATIAPLLGLLGTVLGMIKVFDIIQTLGVGQAKALSGGISEALITTAAGLFIGIPTMVAYTYFNHKSESFILDMEKYVLELLNKLIRFRRGDSAEKIESLKIGD